MALQIIPPTQRIDVKHPVFVIVGAPGSGKSTLGFSMDEPLLIDADQGVARAKNRRYSLSVDGWSDLEGLVDPTNAEALAPFRSLVADTVGRVLNHLETDIAARDPKNGRRGGSLSQQGYGVLKADFAAWFRRVRALDKDVLLLAHDKEERDGDERLLRADMTGSSYAEVMKVADFVGYLRVEGGRRVLDFSPGKWVGKNPAGWDPFVLPHYAEMGAFMARLMTMGREALGSMSAEGIVVAERIGRWKAELEAVTTLDGLVQALASAQVALKEAPKVERVQAFAALERRAVEIGCLWDREQKRFVVDPSRVVAPESVVAVNDAAAVAETVAASEEADAVPADAVTESDIAWQAAESLAAAPMAGVEAQLPPVTEDIYDEAKRSTARTRGRRAPAAVGA